MSGAQWTREQLQAITERGCNLLVAAAAGAGKTAVLVERIIRKISDAENPIDLDALLVVTFTNAAAAEMRERIGMALEEALEANPSSEHLQKQLTLLGKASITTLHSFCLEVVRSNFHLIDLDPVFRIADETEMILMKLDVLEELFESRYEEEDTNEDFHKLIECYSGGKSDEGLQEIVLSLHEFIQSHPWPHKWLEEQTEAFNMPEDTDLCNTVWGKVIVKSATAEIKGMLAMLEEAHKIASMADGLAPYAGCLKNDIRQLEELLGLLENADATGCGWDVLYKAFSAYEAARLPRCGKDADATAQEQVRAARKQVKDKLSKIIDNSFSVASKEAVEEFHMLYPVFRELACLTDDFGKRFSEKKRAKALLDFNDLEHLCLKILLQDDKATQAALDLRDKYAEILVDEYQDSNLIQEVIISTISRAEAGQPNIFMVGDVKQSIYRFRQAKPELFLAKYNTYPSEPGSGNLRILLYKNFRSRHEVINAVNFIFKQTMSKLVGELDYTDEEALNPGASFPDIEEKQGGGSLASIKEAQEPSPCLTYSVEVDLLDLSDESGNAADNGPESEEEADEGGREDEEEPLDAIQAEARIVAGRIRQLVDDKPGSPAFKVYDKKIKGYRDIEYKDIVILLRTTRNWSGIFVEELGLKGIPAYADTGTGYFKTVEIQTVISLLCIIDNPLQDIPLLAVLRSPIYSFTADELAAVRLTDACLPYFEAIRKFASLNNGTTADKAVKFLNDLEDWRSKSLHMSCDELIWYLYTQTSYYSYVGILPGGPQRQANLKLLFEKARQYEETSYKGLFNFINYVQRLRSGSGDMGSAKILGENENVVRIMSIHKSKGLEFPVVFVSGCGKRFNLQDMNNKILMHQELGFGPDLVDPVKRTAWPVISKQAIKYKVRQETLSEEMRILYVAFTRAREKLIITGAVKNFQKAFTGWVKCANGASRLNDFDMLKAASYLDWICPAICNTTTQGDGSPVLHNTGEPSPCVVVPPCFAGFDVRVLTLKDALSGTKVEQKSAEDVVQWLAGNDSSEADGTSRKEIVRRLEWRYPYARSCEIPAKLSVTELKRLYNIVPPEEDASSSELQLPRLIARPAYMEAAKGLSRAEIGTVMHFVMQHLKLDTIGNILKGGAGNGEIAAEIGRQVKAMQKEEFLTQQEADAVDERKIAFFFQTALGARLLASKAVSRETPFNIELDCKEIYGDFCDGIYEGETILLQGVIDCFFEEGSSLVLVDYKTDYVPLSGADRIKEHYDLQIKYYVKALETITGKNVSDKYIYLFHNGEIIAF